MNPSRIDRANRRVVVTGIGLITPLGIGVEPTWTAVVEGRSGLSAIDTFDVSRLNTRVAGLCRDFRPEQFLDGRECARLDRTAQLAVAASGLALADAGLPSLELDGQATGVVLGTGFGGQHSFDEFYRTYTGQGERSALSIPKSMYNAAASQVAIKYKCRGPILTISTACSSGANAIGHGLQLVRHGYADRMLVGGSEAPVTHSVMSAWSDLRVLSVQNEPAQRACKPFSANRDGFVLAEGAAILVLESLEGALRRGSPIRAEVLGYGSSADASHITLPDADGEHLAIAAALRDAQVDPHRVCYINAHGTATKANDATETAALKLAFGDHAQALPISSSKSMLGHAMGASAAIEFGITVLALQNRQVPPTINYEQPDPRCDLDYVISGSRPMIERGGPLCAMSNSFGFGGNNAVLVAGRYD